MSLFNVHRNDHGNQFEIAADNFTLIVQDADWLEQKDGAAERAAKLTEQIALELETIEDLKTRIQGSLEGDVDTVQLTARTLLNAALVALSKITGAARAVSLSVIHPRLISPVTTG